MANSMEAGMASRRQTDKPGYGDAVYAQRGDGLQGNGYVWRIDWREREVFCQFYDDERKGYLKGGIECYSFEDFEGCYDPASFGGMWWL